MIGKKEKSSKSAMATIAPDHFIQRPQKEAATRPAS